MAHKSLAVMGVSTSQCNQVHCAGDNRTLSQKLLHCCQATRNKVSR
ncbi:mCG147066, partial [Mus musculus]